MNYELRITNGDNIAVAKLGGALGGRGGKLLPIAYFLFRRSGVPLSCITTYLESLYSKSK